MVSAVNDPTLTAVKEGGQDNSFAQTHLCRELMFFLLQILFNLALLGVAMAISIVQSPSFISVAPRYFKAVTFSSCWLFMLICAVLFSSL